MNRIDDLINRISNSPVIFYKLNDIVTFINGKGHEKAVSSSGSYIIVNSKYISTDGEIAKYSENQLCPVYIDDILMVMSDLPNGRALAKCFIVNKNNKYTLNQRICCFRNKRKDIIQNKFLYYILNRNQQLLRYDNGVDQTNLRKDDILNIKIPVPRIEVQNEIITILDTIKDLTKNLTSELQDRKKQYEYYRDTLLSFNKDVPFMKLDDICYSIKDGVHNLPITSTNGKYPIISAQNINNGIIDFKTKRFVEDDIYEKEKNRMNIEKGDVLLTIVATIGRTAVVEENNKFLLQRSVCSLKPKENINPYYLKYYLDTYKMQDYMTSNAHGSAQAGLYLNQVSNIKIPIPKRETQDKIVNLLNYFDKICNNLQIGLPAEIELRQKQYEYYRTKLLSFKEDINV